MYFLLLLLLNQKVFSFILCFVCLNFHFVITQNADFAYVPVLNNPPLIMVGRPKGIWRDKMGQ